MVKIFGKQNMNDKKSFFNMLSDKGKRYKKGKKLKGGGNSKCSGMSLGTRGKCISKETLDKNFNYLYAICKGLRNKQQKDALIDKISTNQMACIKQMINSFLQGRVKLSPEDFKKLSRDRKYLYSLISSQTPMSTKKKVLKMKGGMFMLPLLGALAPALIEPIAKSVIAPVAKGIGKVLKL